MDLTLSLEDQKYFKNWIELNLNSISWEGRYLKEFNDFWLNIFSPDISIVLQYEKLNSLIELLSEGPLVSWFNWIREKFICYCFIYKNLDISEISTYSKDRPSVIATVLRDFFVERFPHLEDEISVRFQIGNKLSLNSELSFKQLSEELKISNNLRGSSEYEILSGLEVTLYSEWSKIASALGLKDSGESISMTHNKRRFFGQKFQFLSEIIILFALGALLLFGVKLGNNFYEEYLVKNISLFEPNFLELEKNLIFEDDKKVSANDIKIQMNELEALEKIESKKVFEDEFKTSRYEVETDVVLTSVDALPKDISTANLELSDYEENKKGGYRNSRFGRRKAYRVMMTSVAPDITKEKLINLLKDYKYKQVDNVKPGTKIPGGIYFNLFMPRKYLKKFLSNVSQINEATILESKTSSGGPAGSDKVFIWIKSI